MLLRDPKRRYWLKPVVVYEKGGEWEVTHEFSDFEIEAWFRDEFVGEKNGREISFKEAYSLRWLDMAYSDSQGEMWLKSGVSIRTSLHDFLKVRGLKIKITLEDLLPVDNAEVL